MSALTDDVLYLIRESPRDRLAEDEYLQMCRALGTCSVCEREGFKPYQLDDSARCDGCRP